MDRMKEMLDFVTVVPKEEDGKMRCHKYRFHTMSNLFRFPFLACDLLASETDFCLSMFFPEPKIPGMESEEKEENVWNWDNEEELDTK